jgi:hypothetical protein
MSYGMNENQNVFMEGKRTTSRVTNEPGGKSSVQLGWDPSKQHDDSKTGKGRRGGFIFASQVTFYASSTSLLSSLTISESTERNTAGKGKAREFHESSGILGPI